MTSELNRGHRHLQCIECALSKCTFVPESTKSVGEIALRYDQTFRGFFLTFFEKKL